MIEQQNKQINSQDIIQELNADQYLPEMGGYRPHFQGKPQDYWERTWCEIVCACSMMFVLIAVFTGITAGVIRWAADISSSNLALVSSIIVVIFILIFMVVAFFGSRRKKTRQLLVIRQAMYRFEHSADSGQKLNGNKQQMSKQNFIERGSENRFDTIKYQ